MLRWGTVVIGVEDVLRAASFWGAALGYEPRGGVVDADWAVLEPPGGGPGLALDRSRSPVQDQPRIHLDLYAGHPTDAAAEIERLIGLGATRVDWPHYPKDAGFVVLADTEGNRFCVVDERDHP